MVRWLLRIVVGLAVLLLLGWGALALRYCAAPYADVVWVLACLVIFAFVRPLRRAVLAFGAAFVLLLAWWNTLAPRNDRDWLPDVARTPRAELHGDLLTIHDLRNFDYRSETDYTPRWETRTYDLSQLEGLDLFMSYWGSPSIAHTILSWQFKNGEPLAISIETRKEKGEEYSAIKGFFKQFEIYYVVADERDVIRLRTNYRKENVYLYPLRTPIERARAVLLDYVASINGLAEHAKWYDALTDNCTTSIRTHVKHIGAAAAWDWRILVNGYGDEMLYERGTIANTLPFAALKQASLVDTRAQAADQDPAFSRRIRDGLPR